MNLLKIAFGFYFGMLSMWNFMRTAYVYDGVWGFYAMDTVVALFNLVLAYVCCRMVASPLQERERG